ncbi:hypothetical protein MVES1_003613 [Malassezia vespertilionis]|uniref:uncharacterized protein n=1 Tax=Malassezia vespertilionis TaxID=2020962 RepID=UPI0024B236D5|nr:uncharacterized protein MVES1_003613 [Malassezia vespertilionis]WFD08241.1 hypothetical protein MVES1_003613 [Malassezia vespertilionis]
MSTQQCTPVAQVLAGVQPAWSANEAAYRPARFLRRVHTLQNVLFALASCGFILARVPYAVLDDTTVFGFTSRTMLTFAYSVLWSISLFMLVTSSGGAPRLRAIVCIFSLTLLLCLGEIFRAVLRAPFTVWNWTHFGLLVSLCGVAGCMPSIPLRVVAGGDIAELTAREDARDVLELGDDTPPLFVAPCSAMDNSPLGYLFFWHFMRLIRATAKYGLLRPLDVPVLGHDLQASTLGHAVAQRLAKTMPSSVPRSAPVHIGLWSKNVRRLIWVLIVANKALLTTMFGLTVLCVGAYYGPTFFANRIFTVLEQETDRVQKAMPWVMCLFFTVIFSSMLQGRLWAVLEGDLQVRLSTQLSTILYSKTLRRRIDAQTTQDEDGPTIGGSQVFTLHLVDLKRVAAIAFHLFTLTTVPFELLVGGYFAYRVLGIAAVIGLLATIALLPLIHFVSREFARTNERLMSARDRRMGLLNECFLGIRMIKSQAWEQRFDERIQHPRNAELLAQRNTFFFSALLNCIMQLNPLLVTIVAFSYYTLVLGNQLTPKVAFTALSVFTELRWTLTMLPQSLTSLAQSLISLRRIAEFLESPDVPLVDSAQDPCAPPFVAFVGAAVAWPSTTRTDTFCLHDLSLRFAPSSRTLVCGRIGAGKSLLLLSLLHETDVRAGKVMCPRSPPDAAPYDAESMQEAEFALNTPHWLRADLVGYAPQTPFLLNTNIRENILFGLPMGNASRYNAVLDACSLRPDLAQLEHGDLAHVGENGTELSGGQKARIGLARAIYSRAMVLLLDDVLSAVDAHTAKHIGERVFGGPLLDSRTVVLVSHNVQLMGPRVDRVVYLEHGKAQYEGRASEFLRSHYFSGLVEEEKEEKKAAPEPVPLSANKPASRSNEHREQGGISTRVWTAYIRTGGGWGLCLLTFFLFVVSNLWELVNNTWLRDWSSSLGRSQHDNAWWLSWYVVLVVAGLVFSLLCWLSIFSVSLFASRSLFDAMLWRTLRAPLHFHDQISRGRLLNRFGQDLEVVDGGFAQSIADVMTKATQLLATCIALYMVGGWQFIVALLLLAPFYVFVSEKYVATARDLQRLTSTSRSLVANAFGNAVHGVTLLRAFGAQERFTRDMHTALDNNNRYVWWTSQGARWISQMFNLISSFLMLGSCILILCIPDIDVPSADFSITFLIDLNFVLLILMRMYTVLQTNGVAVERVFEFAASIEQEAPERVEPRPPHSWPAHGAIQVKDLHVGYASQPETDILKGISFSIEGGSSLAVVGPTGSGKSTLASAFLRFVEARQGQILIDGLDIRQMGLADLRSRIQLVPQDPVILSGTLRSALDIVYEYTDEQLLCCLETVHLVDGPASPFANLNMPIAESGSNLSHGQRQLLCLARAILRGATVMLFDEASSSMDNETDTKITELISDSFAQSTVITIAHRLATVIAYDRVLFLENGRIVELDEPVSVSPENGQGGIHS